MERTKAWIALAGVVVTLLGGVASVVALSGSGTKHPSGVITPASQDAAALPADAPAAPVTTTAAAPQPPAPPSTEASKPPGSGAKAPATTTTTVAAQTAADVQRIIQNATSQAQAAAASSPTSPMTKEDAEAQLRALLRQIGINY